MFKKLPQIIEQIVVNVNAATAYDGRKGVLKQNPPD
jgi:hypothetical protein